MSRKSIAADDNQTALPSGETIVMDDGGESKKDTKKCC